MNCVITIQVHLFNLMHVTNSIIEGILGVE